jgi:hypothetical protein
MRKLIKYFTTETNETNRLTKFERWKRAVFQGVGEIIVVFFPFTVLAIILISYLKRWIATIKRSGLAMMIG